MADQLWMVTADEIDGEHSRLIRFLVHAPNIKAATERADVELLQEWDDCQINDDGQIEVFGGEIIIKKWYCERVTEAQALRAFTRGD